MHPLFVPVRILGKGRISLRAGKALARPKPGSSLRKRAAQIMLTCSKANIAGCGFGLKQRPIVTKPSRAFKRAPSPLASALSLLASFRR